MSNKLVLTGVNNAGTISGQIRNALNGTFSITGSQSGQFLATFDYINSSGPTGNVTTPILVLAGGSVTPSGGDVTANHLSAGTIIDGGTY